MANETQLWASSYLKRLRDEADTPDKWNTYVEEFNQAKTDPAFVEKIASIAQYGRMQTGALGWPADIGLGALSFVPHPLAKAASAVGFGLLGGGRLLEGAGRMAEGEVGGGAAEAGWGAADIAFTPFRKWLGMPKAAAKGIKTAVEKGQDVADAYLGSARGVDRPLEVLDQLSTTAARKMPVSKAEEAYHAAPEGQKDAAYQQVVAAEQAAGTPSPYDHLRPQRDAVREMEVQRAAQAATGEQVRYHPTTEGLKPSVLRPDELPPGGMPGQVGQIGREPGGLGQQVLPGLAPAVAHARSQAALQSTKDLHQLGLPSSVRTAQDIGREVQMRGKEPTAAEAKQARAAMDELFEAPPSAAPTGQPSLFRTPRPQEQLPLPGTSRAESPTVGRSFLDAERAAQAPGRPFDTPTPPSRLTGQLDLPLSTAGRVGRAADERNLRFRRTGDITPLVGGRRAALAGGQYGLGLDAAPPLRDTPSEAPRQFYRDPLTGEMQPTRLTEGPFAPFHQAFPRGRGLEKTRPLVRKADWEASYGVAPIPPPRGARRFADDSELAQRSRRTLNRRAKNLQKRVQARLGEIEKLTKEKQQWLRGDDLLQEVAHLESVPIHRRTPEQHGRIRDARERQQATLAQRRNGITQFPKQARLSRVTEMLQDHVDELARWNERGFLGGSASAKRAARIGQMSEGGQPLAPKVPFIRTGMEQQELFGEPLLKSHMWNEAAEAPYQRHGAPDPQLKDIPTAGMSFARSRHDRAGVKKRPFDSRGQFETAASGQTQKAVQEEKIVGTRPESTRNPENIIADQQINPTRTPTSDPEAVAAARKQKDQFPVSNMQSPRHKFAIESMAEKVVRDALLPRMLLTATKARRLPFEDAFDYHPFHQESGLGDAGSIDMWQEYVGDTGHLRELVRLAVLPMTKEGRTILKGLPATSEGGEYFLNMAPSRGGRAAFIDTINKRFNEVRGKSFRGMGTSATSPLPHVTPDIKLTAEGRAISPHEAYNQTIDLAELAENPGYWGHLTGTTKNDAMSALLAHKVPFEDEIVDYLQSREGFEIGNVLRAQADVHHYDRMRQKHFKKKYWADAQAAGVDLDVLRANAIQRQKDAIAKTERALEGTAQERAWAIDALSEWEKDPTRKWGKPSLLAFINADAAQLNVQQTRAELAATMRDHYSRRIHQINTGARPFASEETIHELYKFALDDMSTVQGAQNAAALALFFSTGIRRSELLNLRVGDINFANRTLTLEGLHKGVRPGATAGDIDRLTRAKQAEIPLAPIAVQHLAHLLTFPHKGGTVNDLKATDFVFTARKDVKGRPTLPNREVSLPGNTLNTQLRLLVQRANKLGLNINVDEITPHALRRSMATTLFNAGASEKQVGLALRHADIDAFHKNPDNFTSQAVRDYIGGGLHSPRTRRVKVWTADRIDKELEVVPRGEEGVHEQLVDPVIRGSHTGILFGRNIEEAQQSYGELARAYEDMERRYPLQENRAISRLQRELSDQLVGKMQHGPEISIYPGKKQVRGSLEHSKVRPLRDTRAYHVGDLEGPLPRETREQQVRAAGAMVSGPPRSRLEDVRGATQTYAGPSLELRAYEGVLDGLQQQLATTPKLTRQLKNKTSIEIRQKDIEGAKQTFESKLHDNQGDVGKTIGALTKEASANERPLFEYIREVYDENLAIARTTPAKAIDIRTGKAVSVRPGVVSTEHFVSDVGRDPQVHYKAGEVVTESEVLMKQGKRGMEVTDFDRQQKRSNLNYKWSDEDAKNAYDARMEEYVINASDAAREMTDQTLFNVLMSAVKSGSIDERQAVELLGSKGDRIRNIITAKMAAADDLVAGADELQRAFPAWFGLEGSAAGRGGGPLVQHLRKADPLDRKLAPSLGPELYGEGGPRFEPSKEPSEVARDIYRRTILGQPTSSKSHPTPGSALYGLGTVASSTPHGTTTVKTRMLSGQGLKTAAGQLRHDAMGLIADVLNTMAASEARTGKLPYLTTSIQQGAAVDSAAFQHFLNLRRRTRFEGVQYEDHDRLAAVHDLLDFYEDLFGDIGAAEKQFLSQQTPPIKSEIPF